MSNKLGRLIVFEGIDGSGKKTQFELLINYLKENKITYASFDFPQYGKTFFGNFAGRFLNGEFGHFSRIDPYLASFPYAADRWQVKGKILQAINSVSLVICNRYSPSSIYQAAKIKSTQRRKFFHWVETLEYEIFGIPRPSLVILLHVPLVFAQTMIEKKNKRKYLDGKIKDQYEKDIKYLKKVEDLYLDTVKTNKSWIKIDCVENNKILSPEAVLNKIIIILGEKGYISTSVQV